MKAIRRGPLVRMLWMNHNTLIPTWNLSGNFCVNWKCLVFYIWWCHNLEWNQMVRFGTNTSILIPAKSVCCCIATAAWDLTDLNFILQELREMPIIRLAASVCVCMMEKAASTLFEFKDLMQISLHFQGGNGKFWGKEQLDTNGQGRRRWKPGWSDAQQRWKEGDPHLTPNVVSNGTQCTRLKAKVLVVWSPIPNLNVLHHRSKVGYTQGVLMPPSHGRFSLLIFGHISYHPRVCRK